SLSELGLEDGCRIEYMYLTSWDLQDGNNSNISCTDIRRMMLYGFELSWSNGLCEDGWFLYLDDNSQYRCIQDGNLLQTTQPFSKLNLLSTLVIFFTIVISNTLLII
ncbi:hypothetical protein KIW84_061233, partial [Lathyrus oleraceus]